MAKIEEIIEARGIKKKWLADKVGVAPSTMTNICKGALPTLPVAIKLARVLGMTVEELWGHLVDGEV